jgi:class 3 adenylate cyclase
MRAEPMIHASTPAPALRRRPCVRHSSADSERRTLGRMTDEVTVPLHIGHSGRVADAPQTRFAVTRDGDRVAYQVIGNGPIDVIVTRMPIFPVDLMWDEPRLVRFLTRLSSFCRHVWFDARGTGASDPIALTEGGLMESQVEDMLAVIDEVGCERVVALSTSGNTAGVLFAATHPERTSAVVLANSSVRVRRADDFPEGWSDEELEHGVSTRVATGHQSVEFVAPSLAGDAQFRQWFERAARLAVSPKEELGRLTNAIDSVWGSGAVASVRAPTLVVYRRGLPHVGTYRYTADHIPGAQCVELDGDDLLVFAGDADALVDAIEEFLTGQLSPPPADRVLATVLFTDVVDSTPHAARVGDRRWRELLAAHDAVVRTQLDRFRGQEIRSTGDGVLATFDGPARAIRCACAIRDALGALGLEVRAGLHTGEIELRGDDIAGIAVHVGQRVSAHAGAGEVLVSRTVADLVAGSDIELRDHGEHELKGVPGTWRLYSVASN